MANDNVKQYEAGECIFREGESGDLMYVLIEGAVDLKKRLGRGETVLKIVDKPNDFFGEMAILDDRPRSATAIAAKPTKVIAVDAKTFESMILGNGKFALKIIKVLSDRIRRSNDQVSDLIETMPRERVARGMADYARRHGERIHDGSTKVGYEAMKSWINSRLGIAPDESRPPRRASSRSAPSPGRRRAPRPRSTSFCRSTSSPRTTAATGSDPAVVFFESPPRLVSLKSFQEKH